MGFLDSADFWVFKKFRTPQEACDWLNSKGGEYGSFQNTVNIAFDGINYVLFYTTEKD